MNETPFIEKHREAGGRLVDFSGWNMPIQYSGLAKEHAAVRESAGLFDVSHMGEIDVKGPGTIPFLMHLLTNDVASCEIGQAQYNAMCLPTGGIVDDLVIYRRGEEHVLLCVNASNTQKDLEWVLAQSKDFDVTIEDISAATAQLALQGPKAAAILQSLTKTDLSPIATYRFAEGKVAGRSAIIARTGYTGEDGFEIFMAPEDGPAIWDAIMEAGTPEGMLPVGLGARDTLRLEMKYALYGNDIDETTTPFEASLGWIVKPKKGDFIGREAMMAGRKAGLTRRLVGFELKARGVPRHDYSILDESGAKIGVVTSGTHGPSVKKPIGMAYVPPALRTPGSQFFVEIRGKAIPAETVKTPFYSKD